MYSWKMAANTELNSNNWGIRPSMSIRSEFKFSFSLKSIHSKRISSVLTYLKCPFFQDFNIISCMFMFYFFFILGELILDIFSEIWYCSSLKLKNTRLLFWSVVVCLSVFHFSHFRLLHDHWADYNESSLLIRLK